MQVENQEREILHLSSSLKDMEKLLEAHQQQQIPSRALEASNMELVATEQQLAVLKGQLQQQCKHQAALEAQLEHQNENQAALEAALEAQLEQHGKQQSDRQRALEAQMAVLKGQLAESENAHLQAVNEAATAVAEVTSLCGQVAFQKQQLEEMFENLQKEKSRSEQVSNKSEILQLKQQCNMAETDFKIRECAFELEIEELKQIISELVVAAEEAATIEAARVECKQAKQKTNTDCTFRAALKEAANQHKPGMAASSADVETQGDQLLLQTIKGIVLSHLMDSSISTQPLALQVTTSGESTQLEVQASAVSVVVAVNLYLRWCLVQMQLGKKMDTIDPVKLLATDTVEDLVLVLCLQVAMHLDHQLKTWLPECACD